MNEETFSPKIQHYIEILLPSEKETFERIISCYQKKDLITQCYALVELQIELKIWDDFNSIMVELISGKTEEEISQNPYIMYLYGRKEMINLNLFKSKRYLNLALKNVERGNLDKLDIKILLDILLVSLYEFISQNDETSLDKSKKIIEKLKHQIDGTSLTDSQMKLFDNLESYSKKLVKPKEKVELRKVVLEMQKMIIDLMDNVRFSAFKIGEIDIISPNQLIVLHRSGIPLKRYVRAEKIVDDILLFGGMVRAAKDIISEVFKGEVGKVMKIDYGEEIIILAEFGEKETGIVMITKKDTFHQRRSLHESVKELNRIEMDQNIQKEIPDYTEEMIDDIITKWFGSEYSGEK
ncbi:MAG: hypothetical protein KAS63_08195 [Candidatus Heimdallarchaeota archaeon]|nr:hypothetical protein [Candidatus Heimdallarchaeota archaeon]MCK4955331.1 hypothetical protein [Candidatus Heimdallarchaeota archaeon]